MRDRDDDIDADVTAKRTCTYNKYTSLFEDASTSF